MFQKSLFLAAILSSSLAYAGDLAGQCDDGDHSQFIRAKAFAREEVTVWDQEATSWALAYNNTHKCGTIADYIARYEALFEYAYSESYLNMTFLGLKDAIDVRASASATDRTQQRSDTASKHDGSCARPYAS